MPKVSVVIPAYNAENYLAKCLESILNQTLQDFEIIIINDGSTDGTGAVIERYAAENPGKLRTLTVENGGQGRARNLGIAMTTGDYISFVDADDYIDADMLQVMYTAAVENDADLVTCNYLYGEEPDGYETVVPKVASDQRDMFIDPDVSPCNKLYRGTMLRDHPMVRFPEGLFYEDTAFYFMYIPYVKKLVSVQKPFYHYVIHGNSSVHGQQGKRVVQIFPVMDAMVDYFKKIDLYEEYRDEIEYAYSKILLCSSMGRICQVPERAVRKAAMKQTLRQLRQNFPDYRQNKYLHGIKGKYMKYVAGWNIGLCSTLMFRLGIHQK